MPHLPLLPHGKDEAHHAHAAAEPDSGDVRLDVAHRVVHRQNGDNLTARAVDVERDILVVLAVQVEHRRYELIAQFFIDSLIKENDAVPVEAVPDVDPLPHPVPRVAVGDLGHADGERAPSGTPNCWHGDISCRRPRLRPQRSCPASRGRMRRFCGCP